MATTPPYDIELRGSDRLVDVLKGTGDTSTTYGVDGLFELLWGYLDPESLPDSYATLAARLDAYYTLIINAGTGTALVEAADAEPSSPADGYISTDTDWDEVGFLANANTWTGAQTLVSPVFNTGISGTAVKDEDNMASDSATHICTQQSIKAYIDSGTVTMTNKTLTSPVLNTSVSGTAIKDEDDMSSDSASHLVTQQSVKAYVDALETKLLSLVDYKAGFVPSYVDSDTINFSSGTIAIDLATNEDFYTWAGGDIDFTCGNDESHFVYVDKPASGTALAAGDFTSNTTAPTWNATLRGWYNAGGTARCIFAFKTNGSGNIIEFYVCGRQVFYSTQQTDVFNLDPDTTYTDVTLTVPALDDVIAHVTFFADYSGTVAYLRYRKNGTSGVHYAGYGRSTDSRYSFCSGLCAVDSSGKIEVSFSDSTSNDVTVYTNGYFLPEGM